MMRLLVLVLALLCSACASRLGPDDVADRFWRAIVAQRPATGARYVVARDRALLERGADVLPIANYALGRVVIDGAQAAVATEVTLAGDTPVTLTLDTRLLEESGAWLVDYQATIEAISAQSELARVIGRISALGEAMRKGVEQSTAEIERALPGIERELSRLEGEIRQRVPELRERLEAFARRLEEALRAPSPQPNTPAPPPVPPSGDDTIAL